MTSQTSPSAPAENPLLSPWSGPYGGTPPFGAVKVEHFAPAFEAAMAEALYEVRRVAFDPSPPTFQNTLAPLERAGRTLDRLNRVFDLYAALLSTPEFQAVEREMAPRRVAFEDQIRQDAKLFSRIAAVYRSRETSSLTPEQARLCWLYHQQFVRAGAQLDPAAKSRVTELNQRLATLETAFAQNLLADEDGKTLVLEQGDLAGLPGSVREAARAAAIESGHPGKWAVQNTRSSVEPFLTYSSRRDLREKVLQSFIRRGDNGDTHDNNRVLCEILKLRAERALLLGHETHAHFRLEDQMARTPERALALMEAVWPAAVARAHEEVAEMQALAEKEGVRLTLEPWDYRYYAEKVRKARYDLDQNEVKPYLQLERLRDGMFFVAARLFDLHFHPAQGVEGYHPDARPYEVLDGAGTLVGLWFFDPYARTGKRSGAWMESYRDQERFDGEVPTIVSNNANFVKGPPGAPVLLSWEDATTLFHEFGHALHGLCSSVEYPSLSGTEVARDYVEFPSQLLERWLLSKEVLGRFALHFETGKPIPEELVDRITRASKFNQGFGTVEYLAAALLDMKLHLLGGAEVDPAAFERNTLEALGMPREIVLRHRLPQFAHVFASEGYSAGYYSYLWADTLAADGFEAFTEKGGPFDAEVATRLKHQVLSTGNTLDPMEAYRAFRGHEPGIEALMRWRGFPVRQGRSPAPP